MVVDAGLDVDAGVRIARNQPPDAGVPNVYPGEVVHAHIDVQVHVHDDDVTARSLATGIS